MGSKKIILPVPFMFSFLFFFFTLATTSVSCSVLSSLVMVSQFSCEWTCHICLLYFHLNFDLQKLDRSHFSFPKISLSLLGVSGSGYVHPRSIKWTRIRTEAMVLDFGTAIFPHRMLRLIESRSTAFYLLEAVFSTGCKWTLATGNRLWNWLQGPNFRFQPFVL